MLNSFQHLTFSAPPEIKTLKQVQGDGWWSHQREFKTMTPYIFQRGETISLALDAVTGDPLAVTGIGAGLKAVAPGRTGVNAGTPLAAAFAISPRAASGDIPPGWTLSINATTSAALAVGNYLADARLEIGSGVVITESIALSIRESVSA